MLITQRSVADISMNISLKPASVILADLVGKNLLVEAMSTSLLKTIQ